MTEADKGPIKGILWVLGVAALTIYLFLASCASPQPNGTTYRTPDCTSIPLPVIAMLNEHDYDARCALALEYWNPVQWQRGDGICWWELDLDWFVVGCGANKNFQ